MELMKFIEANWFQITLIGTLISLTIKLTNKVNSYNNRFDEIKQDIKEFKEDTNTEITKINSRLDEDDKKRQEGQERTRLIMEGVEATLISLKNEGHNGPVTASLEAINEYKLKKASE